MPTFLIFDTETTGFSPQNDRVVQIAWIVADHEGVQKEKISHIIKPNGFEIPQSVANIHGITTKIANEKGQDLVQVFEEFAASLSKVDCVVGHNIKFDLDMVKSEFARTNIKSSIDDKLSFCTMQLSTNFCELPRNGVAKGFKAPKLQELYFVLFGTNFTNAHNALADVLATKQCFFDLVSRNIIAVPKLANSEQKIDPNSSSNLSEKKNVEPKNITNNFNAEPERKNLAVSKPVIIQVEVNNPDTLIKPHYTPPPTKDKKELTIHEPMTSHLAAVKTETQNVTTDEVYENAKLIIEYSTPAAEAWGKVILLLPKEYHDKFLMELGKNPNSDPDSIWIGLSKEHQVIMRPYADENANDALAEVRTISSQAENEFKKIYGLIGKQTDLKSIIEKLEKKYGPTQSTTDEKLEAEKSHHKLEQEKKNKLEQEKKMKFDVEQRRADERHQNDKKYIKKKKDAANIFALLGALLAIYVNTFDIGFLTLFYLVFVIIIYFRIRIIL